MDEVILTKSQVRKRVWLQREMTDGNWDERVMENVFYGENYLIDLAEAWLKSIGNARSKSYFERRFLGCDVIDLDQYQKLKVQRDDAQKEMERSKGAYDTLMRQLKEEFGCDSIEAAETYLSELDSEATKLEGEYNEKLESFQTKWKDRIENV